MQTKSMTDFPLRAENITKMYKRFSYASFTVQSDNTCIRGVVGDGRKGETLIFDNIYDDSIPPQSKQ